jgi:hypothetical protein
MNRRTLEPAKCTGHSSQTGEPCKNWPIRGGTVCHKHGGRAPQVKRKAEQRIRELVNPALALIAELIETGRAEDLPASVGLAAARDILDRAGYSPTAKIHLEGDLTVRSPIDVELEDLEKQLREQAEREEHAT